MANTDTETLHEIDLHLSDAVGVAYEITGDFAAAAALVSGRIADTAKTLAEELAALVDDIARAAAQDPMPVRRSAQLHARVRTILDAARTPDHQVLAGLNAYGCVRAVLSADAAADVIDDFRDEAHTKGLEVTVLSAADARGRCYLDSRCGHP